MLRRPHKSPALRREGAGAQPALHTLRGEGAGELLARSGLEGPAALLAGGVGPIVRRGAGRWTERLDAIDCFLKVYEPGAGKLSRIHARAAPARLEAAAARRVAALGVRTPEVVCAVWTEAEGDGPSAILLRALEGDGSLEERLEQGGPPADFPRWFRAHLAPLVRRLHAAGLVHRDLYPGHVWLCEGFRGEPGLIDLARVTRGSLRARVKDLACLRAGLLPFVEANELDRLLAACLPPGGAVLRPWIRAKSARILRHAPRYDPRPDRPRGRLS